MNYSAATSNSSFGIDNWTTDKEDRPSRTLSTSGTRKTINTALSSISFVSSCQSTSSTTDTGHTRNLTSPISLDFNQRKSRQSSYYEEDIKNQPPKQYRFRYPVKI